MPTTLANTLKMTRPDLNAGATTVGLWGYAMHCNLLNVTLTEIILT